jgi:hypothetical protein
MCRYLKQYEIETKCPLPSFSYTLPIKFVTSGTHSITRHAQPRWLCNSIGGSSNDFRTTHHGALFTDVSTFTGTPQLLWAHTLDLRPIFCRPKFVHVQDMHAYMRGSVHVVSRQAGRLLDIGLSACLHNCTRIRRVCCAHLPTERQYREWHIVCTRFSCQVLENTVKEHGLGTYWA